MSNNKNDRKPHKSDGRGDETPPAKAEQSVGDALLDKLLFHTVLTMVPDGAEQPASEGRTENVQSYIEGGNTRSGYLERLEHRSAGVFPEGFTDNLREDNAEEAAVETGRMRLAQM